MTKLVKSLTITLAMLVLCAQVSAEIAGVFIGESYINGESRNTDYEQRRAEAWADYRANLALFEQDCHMAGGNSLLGPFALLEIDDRDPPYHVVSALWQCYWFRRPRMSVW